jgi:predicted RNase H-like HicB family nuclease
MSQTLSFTAVYEPVENGWYQARLIEIPGVVTAARTREEAAELLVDALREYLLSFAEESNGSDAGNDVDHSAVSIEIFAQSA